MLFNSPEFILLFLPIIFFGFFLIARIHHRLAILWLAISSLFFLRLVESEVRLAVGRIGRF
jgi:hypothetical protein